MAQGGATPKFNNLAMMYVIDFEAGWKSHFHLVRSPARLRWQSRAGLPRAGLEPAAADARGIREWIPAGVCLARAGADDGALFDD